MIKTRKEGRKERERERVARRKKRRGYAKERGLARFYAGV
jgi:hypothetical protein